MVDHYTMVRATLTHNGIVTWMPGGKYHTRCTVSVRFFPFDVQRCEIQFGNWVYTTAKVNLTSGFCAEQYALQSYDASGEWDVLDVSTSTIQVTYEQCTSAAPEVLPQVRYTLTVRRKSLYYSITVVVPSVILSAMLSSIPWLPPDSGERMTMGITLLLSFSVFVYGVSDSIPRTSESVPVICKYTT